MMSKSLVFLIACAMSGCAINRNITEVQAIQIAERYLTKIYGEQTVTAQKPLWASRDGDKWDVFGQDLPQTLSGPLAATVDARTGHVETAPMMMTDPVKAEKLLRRQKKAPDI